MPICFSLRDLIYYIGVVVIGIIIVAVLMILFVAFISTLPAECTRSSNLDGEVEIHNLTDTVTSSTYEASGGATSNPSSVYNFYVQDGDGGYHLYNIPAASTTVYCQGNNYRLAYHAEGTLESLTDESNICSILDYLTSKKKQNDFHCYFKLYVPEGSIY